MPISNLSKEEKELVLDFYFRCGDEQHIDRARDLIANNAEAAKLYADLEGTLRELDSIKYEPCPDNLVELTITRLKSAVSQSPTKLQGLLEKEQRKPFHPEKFPSKSAWFSYKNILEISAVAAAILIITALGFPALSSLRHNAQQSACRARLKSIGQGIGRYESENEGQLPAVASAAGAPWWKVGRQGAENHSNTRCLWLLIKKDYVKPEDFICPGHKNAVPIRANSSLMARYNDFPSRRNLSYSFRTNCCQARKRGGSAIIIMSDLNPVFANIPDISERYKFDEFTKIFVSEKLKKMMSPNHAQRGQNTLYRDASVIFLNDRVVNGDDIFTIEGIDQYSGCEVPQEGDIFLAP